MTDHAKGIRLLIIYSAFLVGTAVAMVWHDAFIMTVALGVNWFVWCLAVGALAAEIRHGNRRSSRSRDETAPTPPES